MHHSTQGFRRAFLMGEVAQHSQQLAISRQVRDLAARNRALEQYTSQLNREVRAALDTLANCTQSLAVQPGNRLTKDTLMCLNGIVEQIRQTSQMIESFQAETNLPLAAEAWLERVAVPRLSALDNCLSASAG
jgi:light-regulated signal transduction histidine kinase (bacteriophytochrome)